jgi:hypothetical protein
VLNCDVQEELGKVSCVGFGFIQMVYSFVVCALLSSIAYTRKNAQVVSTLQQTCSNAVIQKLVNRMRSYCLFPACLQVVNGLFQQLVIVLQFDNLPTSCE